MISAKQLRESTGGLVDLIDIEASGILSASLNQLHLLLQWQTVFPACAVQQ